MRKIKFGKRVRFTYPSGRVAVGTVQNVVDGEVKIKYDPECFELNRQGLTDRTRPIIGTGGYVTLPLDRIVEVLR